MVVNYNKNSNGSKTKEWKNNGYAMSIQTNVHTVYILRLDHAKKLTRYYYYDDYSTSKVLPETFGR